MKQSVIPYYFISFVLWLCLFVVLSNDLQAQLWGNELDSLELERLKRREVLAAGHSVQTKVDDKINQHRLLMLAYEWWGVPTNMEQYRLDKAISYRYMPYDTTFGSLNWRDRGGAIHRSNNKIDKKQNLTVMGWHPYWQGDTYKTYNYKLLTHLAYYGYEINPFTGGYNNFQAIYEFIDSDLIATAHLDSCKVLLTVSNRGYNNHFNFFTSDPDVQRNLVDSLRHILRLSGGDGIDINFEEVPLEYKSNFISFVKDLSFAIREDNNNYTVSMSLPIYDKDNVYDLEKLKPWVDFFVINTFNFHIEPTHLKEGPLAPLVAKDASIRGTTFLYEISTTLDKLLGAPYSINNVILEHDLVYENQLKDSLNYHIRWIYRNLEYKTYDLTDILNTIKLTKDHLGRPMWQNPSINRLLAKTNCIGVLSQQYVASRDDDEGVGFFIFKPKKDTLIFKELDLFKNVGIRSEVDSQLLDLNQVVEQYKARIGKKHISSLVLGLPYHGAIWYKDREGIKDFKGYIAYSEILRLAERGLVSVDYDKATHSLVATHRDSLGGFYKIYFDNSTSLSHKFDFAIAQELGGVGLWALGADYAHTDLWETIEESFVTKEVWNADKGVYGRVVVNKGNKIEYTVEYLLKRFGNLIFATLFFITIFICISFAFSILDWKVRDVLFYSGAFRIFYLVLFTIVLLVIGNWFGWFQHKPLTFAIGTGLGLLLTWVASKMVEKEHQKLP